MQIQKSPTKTPQHNKKCIKNSKAVFACADGKCSQNNPFICSDDDCLCSNFHDECKQIKIKIFLKKYEAIATRNQKMQKKLQEKINECFDKLIDQLSDKRDKLIRQIKDGKADWIFDNQDQSIKELENSYCDEKLNGQIVSKILKQHQKQTLEEEKQTKKLNKVMKEVQFQTRKFKVSNIGELTNKLTSALFGMIDGHSFEINTNLIAIDDIQNIVKSKLIFDEFMYRTVTLAQKHKKMNRLSWQLFEALENRFTYFQDEQQDEVNIQCILLKSVLSDVFDMTFTDLLNSKGLYEKTKELLLTQNKTGWNDLENYITTVKSEIQLQKENDAFQRYLLMKYFSFILFELFTLLQMRKSEKGSEEKLPKHAQLKIDRVIMRLVYLYSDKLNKNEYDKEKEKINQIKENLLSFIFMACIYYSYRPRLKKEWLTQFFTTQEIKQLSIFGMEEYTQNQYLQFTISDFRRQLEEIRKSEQFWKVQNCNIRNIYFKESFEILEKATENGVIEKVLSNLNSGKFSVINSKTGDVQMLEEN